MTDTLERRQTNLPAATDPVSLGQVLAASNYFADAKDAAKAAVKVMAGKELGFGPIASMTGVHIIEGKPSVGANLLAAMVKRSDQYRYKVLRLDEQACEIEISERIDGQWQPLAPASTFTVEDAKRAGVGGRKNWQQYPRNMLFARAISNAVTFHCPDLTSGSPIYTPEELGADVDGETGEVVGEPEREAKPEPTPQISAEAAGELAHEALLVLPPDKIARALSRALDHDPGDVSDEQALAEQIRLLDQTQANTLAAWVGDKAEKAADEAWQAKADYEASEAVHES